MFLRANSKESKSCCRAKFCMAESFLITHLDPPESQKVGPDISYISDSCHVIKKTFPFIPIKNQTFLKRKNQSAWDIVLGEKVDSEIWRYLELQVAATVCQILNLSWLPFSPKLFTEQIRFAFRQHQCLYQSIVIIIIIFQNCENDDTHFCMKRHAT